MTTPADASHQDERTPFDLLRTIDLRARRIEREARRFSDDMHAFLTAVAQDAAAGREYARANCPSCGCAPASLEDQPVETV